MKRLCIVVCCCLCSIGFFYRNLNAAILLEDSFESKNMSTTTKSDGFNWEGNNRTSLVMLDSVDDSVAVFNNGSIYNIQPGNDWKAKNGDISMRFRYPANEAMAEQRFNIGASYSDIWIRYWLRVPVNFYYPSGTNNKFFSVWTNTYEGIGATTTWEMRPTGGGGCNIYFKYSQNGGIVGGDLQQQNFISVPNDRGRWMQIVLRVKLASSPSSHDGIIQTYRRWDGEAEFVKLHELLTANNYPSAPPIGLSHGYIMGWANAAYSQDTEWLLDDFTISTTSLLNEVVLEKPIPPIGFTKLGDSN